MSWVSLLHQWFQTFLWPPPHSWGPDLHFQWPMWHLPKSRVSNWIQSFPKPISPMFLIAVNRTHTNPLTETRNQGHPFWVHGLLALGASPSHLIVSFSIKHMLHEARSRTIVSVHFSHLQSQHHIEPVTNVDLLVWIEFPVCSAF